jgi:hypothetical protein
VLVLLLTVAENCDGVPSRVSAGPLIVTVTLAGVTGELPPALFAPLLEQPPPATSAPEIEARSNKETRCCVVTLSSVPMDDLYPKTWWMYRPELLWKCWLPEVNQDIRKRLRAS